MAEPIHVIDVEFVVDGETRLGWVEYYGPGDGSVLRDDRGDLVPMHRATRVRSLDSVLTEMSGQVQETWPPVAAEPVSPGDGWAIAG